MDILLPNIPLYKYWKCIPKKDCTLDSIEDIEDLFPLEVLDGEQAYVCFVCDNGFDSEDEIKKHIIENHRS